MPLERQDRERLFRILDFLLAELTDLKNKFVGIEFKDYQANSDLRRNVERCIENIVNSSLDIAKIILVTENLLIPDTYREYFLNLYANDFIEKDIAETLAEGVKLRNVLAHQYLDIRWKKIEEFLRNEWKAYDKYINCIKKHLEKG
jgi:uncharacterized protein YutE (UPF0331/DUF86 family)